MLKKNCSCVGLLGECCSDSLLKRKGEGARGRAWGRDSSAVGRKLSGTTHKERKKKYRINTNNKAKASRSRSDTRCAIDYLHSDPWAEATLVGTPSSCARLLSRSPPEIQKKECTKHVICCDQKLVNLAQIKCSLATSSITFQDSTGKTNT